MSVSSRALSGTVAVVGAAETDGIGRLPGRSALALHAEAAVNAMADAGLTPREIDGVLCAGQSPVAVSEYLGIVPTYIDGTGVGGCSFMIHVAHALAALNAGYCTTALITHGESGHSRVGQEARPVPLGSWEGQFERPFGTTGAPSRFGLSLLVFMRATGLTHEQLAAVAVSTRAWAHQNPRAFMRDLITVDDVLNSRMVAYPLHLLECCLVTDGGGALIVTSSDRARDFPKPPVYVLGAGESAEHTIISQMSDLTSSRAFRTSGPAAFAMAGLSPKDIDHVMFYDAFAHTPLYALEDLGFVGRGEAGPFVASGATAPGGSLPMNTNGGGLSYTHTGMYGMFAIQESVRQLRGEAAAQVPGVTVSMAHGPGGMFSAAGTLILSTERRA